jgi:hypothetical protein
MFDFHYEQILNLESAVEKRMKRMKRSKKGQETADMVG